MEKQPELNKIDPALILVVPDNYQGEIVVKTSDGKILYTSTLPLAQKALDEEQTDNSSNPQGPPPPPPGGH